MSDDERIEQLELEVKVLRDNNKGLKDKIDEQSKETQLLKEQKQYVIEEYGETIEKQSKEIEELKEKNNLQQDCEEPIERTEEMVNMKWVNHNYILKTESEQKEKQAYIDGTNVAHNLCNKKWEDKIKAKIGKRMQKNNNIIHNSKLKYGKDYVYYDDVQEAKEENRICKEILQSLLEKE